MTTARWIKAQYSRRAVDRAGNVLIDPAANLFAVTEAFDVLNNWRSSHNFPLNSFQVLLRQKARKVDPEALVVQRLKRVPSILQKLRNYPSMQLSRMQDVGGCRAVVRDLRQAADLRSSFLSGTKARHELKAQKDYIAQPKQSGYRSYHLVYGYVSSERPEYNDHLIEIQIRTRLQHAWATAVETVGAFLGQALKSSQGSRPWLDFMSNVGSAFALLEGCTPVPGTPPQPILSNTIRNDSSKLRVHDILTGLGHALSVTSEDERQMAHFYLLTLDVDAKTLNVRQYTRHQLDRASIDYLAIERSLEAHPGRQAVLVRADSMDSLRHAYPNYFLDTQIFLARLNDVTASASMKTTKDTER